MTKKNKQIQQDFLFTTKLQELCEQPMYLNNLRVSASRLSREKDEKAWSATCYERTKGTALYIFCRIAVSVEYT